MGNIILCRSLDQRSPASRNKKSGNRAHHDSRPTLAREFYDARPIRPTLLEPQSDPDQDRPSNLDLRSGTDRSQEIPVGSGPGKSVAPTDSTPCFEVSFSYLLVCLPCQNMGFVAIESFNESFAP